MSATITHPLARANSTGAVSEYPMIRSWTGAELMRSDLQSAERVRRANNPCCMAANVLTTLLSPQPLLSSSSFYGYKKSSILWGLVQVLEAKKWRRDLWEDYEMVVLRSFNLFHPMTKPHEVCASQKVFLLSLMIDRRMIASLHSCSSLSHLNKTDSFFLLPFAWSFQFIIFFSFSLLLLLFNFSICDLKFATSFHLWYARR